MPATRVSKAAVSAVVQAAQDRGVIVGEVFVDIEKRTIRVIAKNEEQKVESSPTPIPWGGKTG